MLKDASVEESMERLTVRPPSLTSAKGKQRAKATAIQPLLFRSQGRYFVRADNIAIPISDASCFTEAVEFLFMCFFVFNVSYPLELRYFYGCLERI